MKLREESYRAATQVKGMSPEIIIVSVADTVHYGAGRSPISDKGEVIGIRRGPRP